MGGPSKELWPRRPFERSLTMSDPEECCSRTRGLECELDSDEEPECCRECNGYYKTAVAKENETLQQVVQTCKVVFFLMLPLIARQLGVFFSRRSNIVSFVAGV